MNKNNIILLILAILFFIFAVLFAYSSFTDIGTNNTYNNMSNSPTIDTPDNTSDNTAANTSNTSTNNTAMTEEEFFDSIDYENFTDFKFMDKNNNELKMSSYIEKPIVVFFSDFINNAEHSARFLQTLEFFYEDYEEQVQFFTIDKNDVPDYASTITLYKDIDGNEKYNIEQLPTLLFIDSEGNVMNQVTSITEDSMEANLDLITGNY